MREQWKPVVGYEGWYEVSSLGRVRRVRGGRGARAGAVLVLLKHNGGYSLVNLCKGGTRSQYLVHALVCEAFHGPRPTPLHEVNHISESGDKRDNRASNLEWVTRKEQQAHARHVLRKMRKIQDGDVVAIRERYTAGESQTSLAREFQVRQATISMIVLGHSFPSLGGPISKPVEKRYLSEKEVRAIRKRSARGETRASIAADLGVSAAHISRIARGDSRK